MQYLIDSENVNGQLGKVKLQNNSVVFFFMTKKARTIPYTFLAEVSKKGCTLKVIDVLTGYKDALDLQLTSYLGYLTTLYPKDTFRILSRDKGYDAVIRYLVENGYKVTRGKCS